MSPSLKTSGAALWQRPMAAIVTLALCVALVAGTAWTVLFEIERLTSSKADGLQWSLSQADVEFLNFRLQLQAAQEAVEDGSAPDVVQRALRDTRLRFDVFYSRMNTVDFSEPFDSIEREQALTIPRGEVVAFLDRTIPLIDGDDAKLAAALPAIAEDAAATGVAVRAFSLAALDAFVRVADANEASLIRKLSLIAAVLFAFIAGLSLIALVLMRLTREAREHAELAEGRANRMHTIVETSLDAIVVTDDLGVIRDYNSAAERIFGYRRDEAIGRRVRDILMTNDQADELQNVVRNVMKARERGDHILHPHEVIAVDRFGRRFPAEVSFDRAADDEHLYVSFVRDISLRKAQEEMITQARDRALAGERSKSEFLAVMSHEMRTPLNGLLGSMQLLRDHELNETQSELLDLMQGSGEHLLGLVNDVLDLAKFEAGKMKAESRPFSVSRLMDGVVESTATLASSNGNDLSWSWVGPASDRLTGDSRKIRQILLNLVSNAAKFTRGGGIDIEVEMLGAERNQIEFRVIDSGIGIAEGDIERIFNDFETLDSSYARQAGGTGLGLGIVRRLAKVMDAELGAESEPGDGSLFWIRIPVSEAAAQDEAVGSESQAPAAVPMEVLLVEDNEINRFIAREMLESDGHTVTEAVDGQAGVEWANAQRFDVILMDISMPVMDGAEAACRIRAGNGASADVPIVALTAHALPEEIERFRAVGISQTLPKPIDRKVLARCLNDIVGGRLSGPGAEPQEADVAAPLIDRDQIETLLAGTGVETGRKLLERFTAETDGCIAALVSGPGDRSEIARLAHACAGTCGTFGLTALRRALADIETKTKRNQDVAQDELAALEPLWRDSLDQLRAIDKRLAVA
ncbi:hybrid sensor histidine kinase/response regulator [Oceanicola sp. S124]|uniref:hybrid sensor histidine kinase/response regulator n=1 Tax=Oceanicola sp. S124 TaxID=1042378 RepID=UPI000A061307|nr:ATP-binding protein [Oceanicola sp. S124]